MSYLNQVQLIGRLGQDPKVLKETSDGVFCKLRVCTTKKYKDQQGEKAERADWHTVSVNNGVGKYVSSYLKKGDLILVTGELRARKYQDKNEQEQVEVFIQAQECKLLARKNNDKPAQAQTNDEDDLGW